MLLAKNGRPLLFLIALGAVLLPSACGDTRTYHGKGSGGMGAVAGNQTDSAGKAGKASGGKSGAGDTNVTPVIGEAGASAGGAGATASGGESGESGSDAGTGRHGGGTGGGDTSNGGESGSDAVLPKCEPACSGDTPACVNSECRACRSDADCGGATPACGPSGACGQCSSTNSTKCDGDAPVCLDQGCVECSPEDGRCSGMLPEQCNSVGQWVKEPACTQPTPECSGGGCICSGATCSGKCVYPDRDVANCGDCGHQCSTTNASATRACSSGQCAPACVAGFQNCGTPLAPDADDGCECAGTGCCGSGCQTQHHSGSLIGSGFSDFFDCDTGSGARAAMDACKTYIGAAPPPVSNTPWFACVDEAPAGFPFVCALTKGTSNCGSGTPLLYLQAYCWGYSDVYAGNIYKPSASSCTADGACAPGTSLVACVNFSSTSTTAGTWN
jgi:hypothetical protein